jgi:nitroimidazol reductase NimA-like FMN-containing flavoprotein (pyridoxamine 5'-phosphate oxidase superfamily)
MRRKDREVTDPVQIEAIISDCDCCRLGIRDGESVYIIPLNFFYQAEPGKGRFYFHCANKGHKLDLLAQHLLVGFELDTRHTLISSTKGCNFTFLYASVIGNGNVETVADVDEKKDALRRIVAKYGGSDEWTFTDAEADSVTILRLNVTEMTAKQNQ